MSRYCDLCGKCVDTNFDIEGVYDEDTDIFSCSSCQDSREVTQGLETEVRP